MPERGPGIRVYLYCAEGYYQTWATEKWYPHLVSEHNAWQKPHTTEN